MASDVGLIELFISPDNICAWVRINPEGDPESFSEKDLLSTLAAHSVVIDDEVRARIHSLVERLRNGELPGEDVLLAEGRSPVPGQDGSILWSPDCDPETRGGGEDDDSVDYYARSSIISVSAGDVICTVVPPTEGRPGCDIYGREIPAAKGRRPPMQFRDSIERDGDGRRMVAKISGRLNVMGHHAWLTPLLVVNRNVDFQSGNIDFDGDVLVRGNVLDLFQIKCTRSVVVKGLIEAARIEAGGDLVVAGGVAGREKAELIVGGKVKARFVDNARLTAQDEIFIQKEAVNSKISTLSRLVTPGAITACTIEARTGIEAGAIGSGAGIRTMLIVGYDQQTQKLLSRVDRELADLLDKIRDDRAKVDSLLQRQSTLTELQRGRLTRMLTSVKQDMSRAEELDKQKQSLQDAIKANREACIKVSRIVREGTTVQIGRAVATLRTSFQGPLRLINHRVDGVERIAASGSKAGAVVLESSEI